MSPATFMQRLPYIIVLCLGALAFTTATPTPAPAASCTVNCDGGFGYTWIDINEPGGPTMGNWTWDGAPGSHRMLNTWDAINVNMPWSFPYYGQFFSQIRLAGSGYLTFDLTSAIQSVNSALPEPVLPDTMIAPLWDELVFYTGSYGPVNNGTAWMVEMDGSMFDRNDRVPFLVRVILFPNGDIQFEYDVWVDTGQFTVGLESPGATYGITTYDDGRGDSGSVDPGYVIRFIAPEVPDCTSSVQVSCGDNFVSTASVEPVPQALVYNCGGSDLQAWEQAFTFTVTDTSAVTAELRGLAAGQDLRLYHLDSCSFVDCDQGDTPILDMGTLSPGDYLLMVDGQAADDNGNFNLHLDCLQLSSDIACGQLGVAGDTTGRTTNFDNYGCRAGDYSGAEQLFDITVGAGEDLQILLQGADPALDLFLFPPGNLDPAACIAWGDEILGGFNLAAGDYVVVVDGPAGSEGAFTLNVECGTFADCSNPEPVPATVTCGDSLSGTVLPGVTSAFKYSCDDGDWLGPENVYRLNVPTASTVVLNFNSPDGLGAFLLEDPNCDESQCVGGNGGAACSTVLSAGDYFLVVDSPTDQGGDFELNVTCVPPNLFDDWEACQSPTGGTNPGDTLKTQWDFNDWWYCVGCGCNGVNPDTLGIAPDPACPNAPACPGPPAGSPNPHRNWTCNGPSGCAFAMYAVVECGTEMHLPLHDVEAGRLRIFDILNDRYVDLSASTPSWSASGTQVAWADSGCAGDPCSGAGGDPDFNNVTNDIFFQAETPGDPVCGVFRMEFYDWGGFDWDLFANCTGNNQPQFEIYSNMCDALEAYEPRAELSIVNPTDDGGCPQPRLQFEVHNTGCVTAENFVIRVMEEDAGGNLIPAQIIDPALPDNNIPVPSLAPGEILPVDIQVNLQNTNNPVVTIFVDGDDDVFECSEASQQGGATACRPQQGLHEFPFPVCANCVAIAQGTVDFARTCEGGTVIFSDDASQVPTCPVGDDLEYMWTATAAPAPAENDPGWTTVDTFELNNVIADTTRYLWVRCSSNPSCMSPNPAQVDVTSHTQPVIDTMALADLDICENGVEISWDPAQFFHDPANGAGSYNIYRGAFAGDPTDQAQVQAACQATYFAGNPIATDLSATTLQDFGTTDNETYVYVIEAEDREPAPTANCPRGPIGGVTSALCLLTPVWDEVDLTAPFDDVGNTLLVSKETQTSYRFEWVDPRADLTRERFRVSRSELSYGTFEVLVNQLDAFSFLDPDAPSLLHFYDVRSMDTCENVTDDPFPPDQDPPLSCGDVSISCGQSITTTTEPCSSVLDSHECFPSRDATSVDRRHVLTIDQDYSQVSLSLLSGAALDIYVYDNQSFVCDSWGPGNVDLLNVTSGRQFLVFIDGETGEQGDYTLSVNCTP